MKGKGVKKGKPGPFFFLPEFWLRAGRRFVEGRAVEEKALKFRRRGKRGLISDEGGRCHVERRNQKQENLLQRKGIVFGLWGKRKSASSMREKKKIATKRSKKRDLSFLYVVRHKESNP